MAEDGFIYLGSYADYLADVSHPDAGDLTKTLGSWGVEVKNVAILVAVGVASDGCREVLGITEGEKEDKASWLQFLRHLKQRGLCGTRLLVSDACLGLVEAMGEVFPKADWQRCVVHW